MNSIQLQLSSSTITNIRQLNNSMDINQRCTHLNINRNENAENNCDRFKKLVEENVLGFKKLVEENFLGFRKLVEENSLGIILQVYNEFDGINNILMLEKQILILLFDCNKAFADHPIVFNQL